MINKIIWMLEVPYTKSRLENEIFQRIYTYRGVVTITQIGGEISEKKWRASVF